MVSAHERSRKYLTGTGNLNTALQAAKDSGAFRGDKGDPGAKGDPGTPGKTPVRGTDYWTAADKQEIVNSVIAALPDGTEVSY